MIRRRYLQDTSTPRTYALPGEGIPAPPEWHADALCAQADPDTWFPENGRNDLVKAALAICKACPVQPQCFEASIDERWGIWAGVTERHRQRLRTSRRKGAA